MHFQTPNVYQDMKKYMKYFIIVSEICENENICTYGDVREDRLRDDARIKHEELTDVFKEVTLHESRDIAFEHTQVLAERSKGSRHSRLSIVVSLADICRLKFFSS